MDADSNFPQASQIGTTNVYVDPLGGFIASQDEEKIKELNEALSDANQALFSDLTDKLAEKLAKKLLDTDEIPCAVDVLKGLNDANQNDIDSAQHDAAAAKVLEDLTGYVIDGIDSQIVAADIFTAAKDQRDKIKGLLDILDKLSKNPDCFKTYAQVQAEMAAAEQQLQQILQELDAGLIEIGPQPQGGAVIWASIGSNTGLLYTFDPIAPQPPAIPAPPVVQNNGGTVNPPTVNQDPDGAMRGPGRARA